MLTVSQLYIFPIKSLAGIAVDEAFVTDRGFRHDRRWMLVDPQNRFMTQRKFPKMARLQPVLEENSLRIQSLEYTIDDLIVPLALADTDTAEVSIWNATCAAKCVGKQADGWFSEVLGADCRLVYMPDDSRRPVDTTSGYAPEGKFTSFADAYPFLLMGEASLDDLNSRLAQPVSILRFRPNIVFSGGTPYQEDAMEDFRINGVSFAGLENCARCNVPTVDPATGEMTSDKEPLRTLTRYRLQDRKIVLGRNVVHSGTGVVRVGDEIEPG